ncbi:hypothetical protein [Lentibacillus sediminis]|uniref:hypothetical protein n=1 Tax=Lentibacillus sediminis TaxID=1940529 RepID=UPI000C1C3DE4|nr:hypothetical protein [Lentibacillus sediminis]
MNEDNLEYVWYASFGSNLCEERFLCYIKGGRPPGSQKTETGCRDQSLPLQIRSVQLDFPLYFSHHSDRWGGGVAFIGTTKSSVAGTLARMYLITKSQFADVVKQENGGSVLEINFDHIVEKGSEVVQETRYGNILYAGKYDDYPIFTFTHFLDMDEKDFTVPSKSYLTMLISGYKEAYAMSDAQIAEYLVHKPGVESNYHTKELLQIIKDV